MTELETIREFLKQKRIAVVGVSREPRNFSRTLFREFQRRGYDAVPVNPGVSEMEGRPCFARIEEVTPAVDAALLMTPPKVTAGVVRDCVNAGIARIWMYRATGSGAVSTDAVRFCEANGIRVVAGRCPYMFWNDAGWFHRFHGLLAKLAGRFPR